MKNAMPEYLNSNCDPICSGYCDQVVKKAQEGQNIERWFITIGHAGFNSEANNRNGYATMLAAASAWSKYSGLAGSRAGGR